MTRLVLEISSLISRAINVLLGGDADTSLSARVHIDGWRRLETIIDMLFLPLEGPGHCRAAWEADVAGGCAQIARHEASANH